jgi:hypothetical protein
MAYTSIDNPELYFQTKTYAGNSSTQSITLDGSENMRPDWVWIKNRSDSRKHNLYDSVRGATKRLVSNDNVAEDTAGNGLTSFDSDGFTSGSEQDTNHNGNNFVAWNWLAGGSASSNSDGSITSSVSASTTAGFSIVSYTGNGSSGSTVGHGLGQTPAWILVKNRDQTDKWAVFHQSLPNGANSYMELDQSGASSNLSLSPPYWGTPSSTTFGGLHFDSTNASGEKYIAYCFAEKTGYSKFGSYTGNGSTDGAFVYTGFKPAWVMVKNAASVENWIMYDNKRDPINVMDTIFRANTDAAENTASAHNIDFLSNGFKQRNSDNQTNKSNEQFIYMAFAGAPFVTAGTKAAGTAR